MSLDSCKEYALHREKIIKRLMASKSLSKLTPGLTQFLDQLVERHIPITIATSSTLSAFQTYLDYFHFDQWFDLSLLVYNNGSYPGKPAPDAYLRAAKKLNLKPHNCLVFEDAPNGIESAYHAGVGMIVAVNSPDRMSGLLSLPGVSWGIHDFTEISADTFF